VRALVPARGVFVILDQRGHFKNDDVTTLEVMMVGVMMVVVVMVGKVVRLM